MLHLRNLILILSLIACVGFGIAVETGCAIALASILTVLPAAAAAATPPIAVSAAGVIREIFWTACWRRAAWSG